MTNKHIPVRKILLRRSYDSCLILLLVFLVSGCFEEEEPDFLLDPVQQSNDSLTFVARVISTGSARIKSIGFIVMDNNIPNIEHGERFIAGDLIENSVFSVRVPNKYPSHKVLYLSAFIENTFDEYYSEFNEFTIEEHLAEISDFDPKEVEEGDFIMIYGNYFGENKQNVKLQVGEYSLPIFQIMEDRIIAKIPGYSRQGSYRIKLIKGDMVVYSEDSLKLEGPVIHSFCQEIEGDMMHIYLKGEGFKQETWLNVIEISSNNLKYNNIYNLEIVSSTNFEIHARIPYGQIYPGSYKLKLSCENKYCIAKGLISVPSSWSRLANIPEGIHSPASFSIDSFIYVCTGTINPMINTGSTNQVLRYNLNSNTWNRLPDFPGKTRYQATGFSIGGKGYILAGIPPDFGKLLADVWSYDPVTAKWNQLSDYPGGPQYGMSAITLEGKAYVGMGSRYNRLWEFNPEDNSWSELPACPEPNQNGSHQVYMTEMDGIIYLTYSDSDFNMKYYSYNIDSREWKFIKDIDINPTCLLKHGSNFYLFDSQYDYALHISESFLYQFSPLNCTLGKKICIFPGSRRAFFGEIKLVVDGTFYYGGGSLDRQQLDDFWSVNLKNFTE